MPFRTRTDLPNRRAKSWRRKAGKRANASPTHVQLMESKISCTWSSAFIACSHVVPSIRQPGAEAAPRAAAAVSEHIVFTEMSAAAPPKIDPATACAIGRPCEAARRTNASIEEESVARSSNMA